MTSFVWKIEDIIAKDDVISCAKYLVTASNELGDVLVETEGNWYFNGIFNKPYLEITEQDVIDLIKKEAIKDGLNIIESRLDEQLSYLENNTAKIPAPWLPQVFTPNV